MSISNSYPTQRPKLNLVFNGGSDQLDSRISFSRADSTPSAVHYWSNESHLSSENLITQSQFSGWAKLTSPTVTAAYTNGPDGSSNTATRLQSASGSHRYFYSTATSWTSGQQYTVSCWVKSNTGVAQTFAFFLPSTAYATADLTTHATDWTRITATFTAYASSTYCGFKLLSANTTDLSIWGFQVNSGANALDYQATSGQIHRSYAPTLKSVATSGQPRFEFDPASDGQSVAKGLLVESQATNLQTYSSDFTSWSGQNRVTTTSNVAIAPNGLLEADIVIANTSSTQSHNLSNTSTVASGTSYTASVYAKDAGQRYVQLSGSTGAFGGSQYATFDLQTGSVDTTGVTASAESVGNGWWRIQATMTATGSGSGGATIGLANSATASRLPLFVGNEHDGIILFGYQLEVGSAASSLISTSGSTASRAADSCSVVDATLFSSGEHTIIWEGDTDYAPNDKRFFALSDGSMNNRFVADHDNGTATRLRNWADGVKNVDKSTGVVDMLVGSHKLAATVKTNESQLVVDGTRRQVDTDCVVGGGIDQLAINSSTTGAGSTYNMNGHCKRITYYNVALSQAEAEALTSNP